MVSLKLSNVNDLSEPLSSDQPFEKIRFIEEVGLMFELVGLPRMAGRIFGWLLICEPQQQSHSELADVLKASKGSISTMTRLLIQIGFIERISIPGDRRDYFQIKPHAWTQLTKQRMAQITAFKELGQRGMDLMGDVPAKHKERLREMRDIHAFWERELPLLDQRWDEEQQSSHRSDD